MTAPSSSPKDFPGTLYDGDGTRLAGTGPEFSLETTQALPHKALIRDRPGAEEVAVLERGTGVSGAAITGAGLVLGLPVGVILAMPAQALRPEGRAVGMGLFYTWLYIGNAALPPAAGWPQDGTGSAAAPLFLTTLLVAAMLPLYVLFQAILQGRTAAGPRSAGA